jgi:hypothetical protein
LIDSEKLFGISYKSNIYNMMSGTAGKRKAGVTEPNLNPINSNMSESARKRQEIAMAVDTGSEVDIGSEDEAAGCGACTQKAQKKIQSLQETGEVEILYRISDPLNPHNITTRYCLGGEYRSEKDWPVTLHYRQPEKQGKPGKLYEVEFPLGDGLGKIFAINISKSLHEAACLNGTIIAALEEYLTTNFDPNAFGLVDTVAKALIPGIVEGGGKLRERQALVGCLKAKLNQAFAGYGSTLGMLPLRPANSVHM